MSYTEDVHAESLLLILSKNKPCNLCPISEGLRIGMKTNASCSLCRAFISVHNISLCPCQYHGKEKAIQLTWLALEKKGYLE